MYTFVVQYYKLHFKLTIEANPSKPTRNCVHESFRIDGHTLEWKKLNRKRQNNYQCPTHGVEIIYIGTADKCVAYWYGSAVTNVVIVAY